VRCFFFPMLRPPPRPTPFPYTTLFRSLAAQIRRAVKLRRAARVRRPGWAGAGRAAAGAARGRELEPLDPGAAQLGRGARRRDGQDRKSTRLNFQSRRDLVCRLLLEKKK